MTSQLATQISGGKLADPHLDRVIVTLKSSWIARYNFSCLWVERFPHSPSNQVFFKRHFSKTNKVHSKSPPLFFWCCYIFLFLAPGLIKLPIKNQEALWSGWWLKLNRSSPASPARCSDLSWGLQDEKIWKIPGLLGAQSSMELWMEDDVPCQFVG